jgi:hypothetical protein
MQDTKIDFTKFDPARMFDVEAVLDQVHNNSRTALGYVTDARSRDTAQTMVDASIAFARAQVQAAQAFTESMKSVMSLRH